MITNGRRQIPELLVTGDGIVARMAAIAMRRAFVGTRVTLALAGDVSPGDDPFRVLWPAALARFEAMGFSADALVAAGMASWRIGERLSGWSDTPFTVAPGPGLPSIAGADPRELASLHGWHEAVQAGPGARLIATGRYAPGFEGRSRLLDAVDSALRIATGPMTALLDRELTRAGIAIVRTRDRPRDGFVVSIPTAPAPSGHLDEQAAPPVGTSAALLVDAYERTTDGIRHRWIDPSGRAIVSRHAPTASAEHALRPSATTPWTDGMVVVDGLGGTPGPMFELGASLAVWAIGSIIDLAPGMRHERLLAAEHNRRVGPIVDDAVAFAAAPEAIARYRELGEPLPEVLERVVGHYVRYGRACPPDESMVGAEAWGQLLRGLDVRRRRPDPFALSVPETDARAALTAFEREINELPELMPDYAAWLREVRARRLSG